MYDWNEAVRSLNVGLPDDIARLKAAGYYKEAIARIDRLLAEDWTKTQNSPATNGSAAPEGYVPPENPTPHGVDALREALTVQKEIMRRLPGEYCWTEAEAIARMQERVKGFTAEEFRALDWEGRMDWRFVEGEKRYQERFAETLLATHADLAARKKTPDAPSNKNEERHRLCEKMMQEGSASADITLRTSIRMSDEAFAAALEKARAEGRDTIHVRAWLALPAACPSQSHITLDRFTETPGHIAAEDAPQRTVYWEADLAENRTFGAEYSYRETAVYADPLSFTPDPEQPDFYTGEEAPHIVFTPYLRALAAQLTLHSRAQLGVVALHKADGVDDVLVHTAFPPNVYAVHGGKRPYGDPCRGTFYRHPSFPPPSISLTASPWWTKRRRSAHLCASRRPAPWQTP